MAYLDSRRRPDFGSMAAVVAIHGAVGAALVFGLTISGVIPPPDLPIVGIDVKPTPTPPAPPPPPKPEVTEPATSQRDIVIPVPPIPLPQPGPTMDHTDVLPPLPLPPLPLPQPGTGEGTKPIPPIATPKPGYAPVAARPRTDPKGWVTDADYRGNWIRQEMTGKARFRLDIAADGTVANCTITASSGHPALDQATCALVTRRAKFQPARGGEGVPVAGSYTSAIDWQLPE